MGLGFSTQETVGLVVSTTFTAEVQMLVLLELSVALQETLVVPSGKADPEAGQLVEEKPQLSEALALKDATALPDYVHSTVCSAGQLIPGGVTS